FSLFSASLGETATTSESPWSSYPTASRPPWLSEAWLRIGTSGSDGSGPEAGCTPERLPSSLRSLPSAGTPFLGLGCFCALLTCCCRFVRIDAPPHSRFVWSLEEPKDP